MRLASILVSTTVLVSPIAAQELLVDGVTSFLGGRGSGAWFERGGTVWVTDGTPTGTRDTGVATGPHSDATERLIVYRADRIDWLSPDGTSTVITPPAHNYGREDATIPTVVAAVETESMWSRQRDRAQSPNRRSNS